MTSLPSRRSSISSARPGPTPAPADRPLGPAERVDTAAAIDRFLSLPLKPGRAPRRMRAGEPADLRLLREPRAEALRRPSAELVAATIVNGAPAHRSRLRANG